MNFEAGYVVTSRTPEGRIYLRNCSLVEEVIFGLYNVEGTLGELAMRWYPGDSRFPPKMRLECYSDGFRSLATFSELLERLSEYPQGMETETFVDLLQECSFEEKETR